MGMKSHLGELESGIVDFNVPCSVFHVFDPHSCSCTSGGVIISFRVFSPHLPTSALVIQLSRPSTLPRVQRLCQHRRRLPANPWAFGRPHHDPARPSTASAQPSGLDGRSSDQRQFQGSIRYMEADLKYCDVLSAA